MESLNKKLGDGRCVAGVLLGLRSPDAAELMSQAGFDFLLIDAEHSSIGPAATLEMIRAVERGGALPLVRVPAGSPARVQAALDAGAKGILFPQVRRLEEVEQAVALCRYPPQGVRGLGPGRASQYGMNLLDYAAVANEEISVMIQVETMEAVEGIDEIASFPGVDLVFIGPGDLSQILGIPGQIHHPKIREIGRRVLAVCQEHSRPVGTLALDRQTLAYWKKRGVQLFALGTDAFLLAQSCQASLAWWEESRQG